MKNNNLQTGLIIESWFQKKDRQCVFVIFTHAGIAADVGIAFSRMCLFVCTLKGKQLERMTLNLVHVYSIAVGSACIDPTIDERLRKLSWSHGS